MAASSPSGTQDNSEVFHRITEIPAAAADGLEDHPLAIGLDAALTDTDGSETLSIRLSGFPAGATFNLGAADGADWVIAGAEALDLSTLTMTPPAGWNGRFTLTATATATEGANGDTASTTVTEDYTIEAVDDPLITGNGTLYGDAGNNMIQGGTGDDTLYGGAGDDTLYGEDGNDDLYGEDGNDTLYGEKCSDDLYGGSGADTFVFVSDDIGSMDSIRDFNLAESDKLDLSDFLTQYDPLTDAIEDFVRISDSGPNSTVSVDVDGGGDSFAGVAVISGQTGLTDEQWLLDNGYLII